MPKSRTTESYLLLQKQHFQLDVSNHQSNQSPQVSSLDEEPKIIKTGLREATDKYQAEVIRQAYRGNNNNWAATAKQLKLDAGNLHRLAKRLNLK